MITYYKEWEPVQAKFGLKVDGYAGVNTLKCVARELEVGENWILVQAKCGVAQDGKAGKKTACAVLEKLNSKKEVKPNSCKFVAPRKEDIRSGKSCYGKAGDESNLVSIVPPYQLYFDTTPVKTIRVHKLIASAVEEALKLVLHTYGLSRIKELKLDKFDGCFNNRSVRGGTSTSMHAWGIAIDWYASANGMNDKTGKAPLSKEVYNDWWNIWESVGARSFGRRNGYDWMHVEFVSPLKGE